MGWPQLVARPFYSKKKEGVKRMQRRQFLGAAILPLMLNVNSAKAAGGGTVPYSKKVYEDALASGKPFMLDFYASW
jgi:hypothetical protein